MVRIQKVTATTLSFLVAKVAKQRGRMSQALAVADTAPVFTWRARGNGIPLTATVDRVPAPSMRLKQERGSPETSDEGSASAAAAQKRVTRTARASIANQYSSAWPLDREAGRIMRPSETRQGPGCEGPAACPRTSGSGWKHRRWTDPGEITLCGIEHSSG